MPEERDAIAGGFVGVIYSVFAAIILVVAIVLLVIW